MSTPKSKQAVPLSIPTREEAIAAGQEYRSAVAKAHDWTVEPVLFGQVQAKTVRRLAQRGEDKDVTIVTMLKHTGERCAIFSSRDLQDRLDLMEVGQVWRVEREHTAKLDGSKTLHVYHAVRLEDYEDKWTVPEV